MALAIDSEVPRYHIYKDARSAGMNFELPCSPGSVIVKPGMPLYMTHASIH